MIYFTFVTRKSSLPVFIIKYFTFNDTLFGQEGPFSHFMFHHQFSINDYYLTYLFIYFSHLPVSKIKILFTNFTQQNEHFK